MYKGDEDGRENEYISERNFGGNLAFQHGGTLSDRQPRFRAVPAPTHRDPVLHRASRRSGGLVVLPFSVPEPQSHSIILGCKKWIEYFFQIHFFNPNSRIMY